MSWGDVRNDGRRGLTGTLIEGSIGLKHRNLTKRAGCSVTMLRVRRMTDTQCDRAKNEHRDRRPERGRIMAKGQTADGCGMARPCRGETGMGPHQMGPCQPARADRGAGWIGQGRSCLSCRYLLPHHYVERA